jgi:oleate hydratase
MRRFTISVLAAVMALTLSCGGEKKSAVTDKTQLYIIGSGIAGLSAAVFAIRDGHVPGKNIHIFEELKVVGGALDAKGDSKKNYSARGARLINEKAYQCYWDMLSAVPTLAEQEAMEKENRKIEFPDPKPPKMSLKDEIFEFNRTHKLNAATRLVGKEGARIDHTKLGLTMRDRTDLMGLIFISEKSIDGKRMDEYFQPSFFKTNFWYLYASMFGFEPWHSLIECKRYIQRFFHDLHTITTLHESGWNTPYNNYDSIVLPITKWLLSQGVDLQAGCRITDVDFKPSKTEKTVETIHYVKNGKNEEIVVKNGDFVFITIGSKVADSREGGMNKAAELVRDKRDGGWSLWKKMANKVPDMGNPDAFGGIVDQTKWVVFTVTTKGPLFTDMLKNYSRVKVQGEQHILSCIDSNWGLGMHIPFQPFYKNQPPDTTVMIGYGLYGNTKGNYIKKTMTDCTGEELLTEFCFHMGFMKELPEIKKVTVSIPNNLPYATSQFAPRKIADRPDVVPKGSTNLALMGQYVEIPDDCVFLVDFSTRSAQMGVYKLLNVDKEVTPVYKGIYNPIQWVRAFFAI